MKNIYEDIAKRTGGDIYIGVVGPVRTGKSTFIRRFMEKLIVPNISDSAMRQRTIDELPQSAGGRTIQTSEPKLVPEEAVEVNLDGNVRLRVRAADCVGYIVPDAIGYMEENAPRMVKTPWFPEEIPFGMAAEIGTQKVISEHSTVGVVVTTDGSITGIDRAQYEECEKRVVRELKEINKPFVILLNTVRPKSDETAALAEKMRNEYGAAVLPVSCTELTEEDIKGVLREMLSAFPVREIRVRLPQWLCALEREHEARREVFEAVREACKSIETMGDVKRLEALPDSVDLITAAQVVSLDMGTGTAEVRADTDESLFYKIIGEKTGLDIGSEGELLGALRELSEIKRKYERFAPALEEAMSVGYGIVMPEQSELCLHEPEIIKQGGRYGVRLRASAPSIHLMRANIHTTVSPIVGTERQSEELVMYLLEGYKEDSARLWTSDIFGKSLQELVQEGLCAKLGRMPSEARMKLQETIERVINEGCGGLICFIL